MANMITSNNTTDYNRAVDAINQKQSAIKQQLEQLVMMLQYNSAISSEGVEQVRQLVIRSQKYINGNDYLIGYIW